LAISGSLWTVVVYERTDIEYGARLFNMHCIACHGENGDLVPQINLRN
jgi:cytochrome c